MNEMQRVCKARKKEMGVGKRSTHKKKKKLIPGKQGRLIMQKDPMHNTRNRKTKSTGIEVSQ